MSSSYAGKIKWGSCDAHEKAKLEESYVNTMYAVDGLHVGVYVYSSETFASSEQWN